MWVDLVCWGWEPGKGAVGLAPKGQTSTNHSGSQEVMHCLAWIYFFSVPYHLRTVEFINSLWCDRHYYSFCRVNDPPLCCWAVGGELSGRCLSSVVLSENPAFLWKKLLMLNNRPEIFAKKPQQTNKKTHTKTKKQLSVFTFFKCSSGQIQFQY